MVSLRNVAASGLSSALAAYLLWGALPIYWKALRHVDALEVLSHRILWSAILLTGLVVILRRFSDLVRVVRAGELFYPLGLTALLISVNWYLYIWAVTSGHVLETSLGYFINPLVSVALGTFFLRERLRPAQRAAVALACVAVLYLVVMAGRLPWIALTLALTFALYGLFKKKGTAGAMTGLTLETLLLTGPCLLFIVWRAANGSGAFPREGMTTNLLLVGAGLVTAAPLLLFGIAARQLPLTILGFCQYLAPTVQFLLAILLYREPFTAAHAVTFGLIWLGIAIFVADALRARRNH